MPTSPNATGTFKYAGSRADSVLIEPKLLEAAEAHAGAHGGAVIVPIDGVQYRLTMGPGTPLEKRYLIPHYPREGSRDERKELLLQSRIRRFFYSAQKDIDVERTCGQLDAELTDFIDSYARIQRGAIFSVGLPYGEMTVEEKRTVFKGSHLVGHIVNRLGRCGRIILHGGDTKGEGAIEPMDAIIRRWSDTPEDDLARLPEMKKPERDALRRELLSKDFQYWLNVLTRQYDPKREPIFRYEEKGESKTFSGDELMRCVVSRNGRRDHDGVFSYLIYEIGKTLTDDLWIDKQERRAEADPQGVAYMKPREVRRFRDQHEDRTVDGIVTNIGLTCEAIDEVYRQIQVVADNPAMSQFLRSQRPDMDAMDSSYYNASDYRGLLRHYADMGRRRSCTQSKDAGNFHPVAVGFNQMNADIKFLHRKMEKALELPGSNREKLREGLALIERGIDLIDDMAEMRIPRNRNAPHVYAREENPGRDCSSVGRLADKIEAWRKSKSVSRG